MLRSISPLLYLSPLLLLATPVLAENMPVRGPIPFESFDRNGDNMISPQEYVETHNLRKKQRAAAGMPGKAMMTPSFTDFDSNGDNMISRDELDRGRASMGMGQGMGPGMGAGMGPGMGMGRNMPAFSDFDLNGDGKLMKDEFYEARAKRMQQRAEQGYPLRNADRAPTFESVDRNGDGKISPDEFKTHQLEHRKMIQQNRPGN